MTYTIHTIETAPEAAKETFADVRKAYRFVPNLLGVMAEAPALMKAYLSLSRFFEETSFTPTERQVVLMTANYENECTYCMAAHSISAAMKMVPENVITALREGRPIEDAKLEALRRFSKAVVVNRGWPSEQDIEAFEEAGYSRSNALEVVLGAGLKILSNYTNHLAQTPLDRVFAPAEWKKAS